MTAERIDHVIVLMLENRAFDHMLGWMRHPTPFDGIPPGFTLPEAPGSARSYPVSRRGRPNIYPDPDHEHAAVMRQLFLANPPYPHLGAATNRGFVWDFILHTAATRPGLLGRIWNAIRRIFGWREPPTSPVDEPVASFDDPVPSGVDGPSVLRTLAREYAFADRWFSSVPGQTWPNRNFAHAGTSAGEVNIHVRFYTDPTVFEALETAGHTARIYHDGPPQSWAFPKLWWPPRGMFQPMGAFYDAVRDDALPAYTFIEPRHFSLLKGYTNNQHPGDNARDGLNFAAGESLIRDIYHALLANESVWKKSLLIITYDEHGGLFDHAPPPWDPARFATGDVSRDGFRFDLLGVRVPAVFVSPWIERGKVDTTFYDHTSIISSLRKRFGLGPLRSRDAQAPTFWHLITETYRPRAELPRFDTTPSDADLTLRSAKLAPPKPDAPARLDHFQESLVRLTEMVERGLQEAEQVGDSMPPETMRARLLEVPPALLPPLSEEALDLYLLTVTERMHRAR